MKLEELGDFSLQFMPVLANKRPIHKLWEQTRKEYDFTNAEACGLVCGSISGNIEVIDIDSKYDITPNKTLFRDYKNAIHKISPELLKKLVVQETVSGGYHFIYKCDFIEGNKKLAERETTHQEKHETYEKAFAHAMSTLEESEDKEYKANQQANNASKNDKVRVLLETRGEKGYIACAPTKGYKFLYGDFFNVQKISVEERNILINVAYSFNEVLKEPIKHKEMPSKNFKGLSPSEDYDNRGDVLELLKRHGWQEVGRKGKKILFKRPGDTKAEHSGNFDQEKNWFSVFTTSTEFQSQTPYLPYAVFCLLECGGDFTLVPSRLKELGYGDSEEDKRDNSISIPSVIDMSNDDLDFVATEEDYSDYLETWRNGTFEKGLPTGFSDLDEHFLFKEGNLVIVNGIDNVGKSTVIWYLANLSAMLHEWEWVIFSSENKVGGVIRKLIEFYWSKSIRNQTAEEYKIAKEWVKKYFKIIKCKDSLFNYMDILNMIKKIKKLYPNIKGAMIDPYNSLKIDVPLKSKQSTYEYHYEAASIIQLFGKQNNISCYLNVHVGTIGARKKDKQNHTMAPQKEDTEMGVMFANKADEFLTVHRYVQKKDEFLFTEIHVRKVKEVETGGSVTLHDKPFKMMMSDNFSGFQCKDKKENPVKIIHGFELPYSQRPTITSPITPIGYPHIERQESIHFQENKSKFNPSEEQSTGELPF